MRLSCVLCSPRLFRHSAGNHSTIAIPTGYLRQAGRRERLRGLRVCRTETILVGCSEGGSNTGGYKVASAGAISAFAGNFFAANDVNLPAIQSILRHAKPSTTALYTHCVNSAQMAAQAKFLDAIKVTAAAV